MNVLVIAAHPDDEVLGCGGTMARLAREGHAVFVAILGEGITSRYARREEADSEHVRELHGCSRRVSEILGVKDVFLYSLPDNRFDAVPLLNVVKIIEELLLNVRPEVVYTQHGGDLNMDHVIVFRAALIATRPIKGQSVRSVYGYEVASSTEWSFQQFAPMFRPSVFVDITETLDTKIQAMESYESEARGFPHPRSPEALRAMAVRWGSVAGLGAAEAFSCIREIR